MLRRIGGAVAVALSLSGAFLVSTGPAGASTSGPPPAPRAAAPIGYWLAAGDGGVFAFDVSFFGSGTTGGACTFDPQPPSTLDARHGCDAITAAPKGNGYWLTNLARGPQGIGVVAAPGCTSLNGASGSWVGTASSLSGAGFWVVAANGGVLGCGDIPAPFGGLATTSLNASVVGIAATPDREGYWLVSADGGVFAFGDASYGGSMAGTALDAPVVGIATAPTAQGYWLAAADGGVFTFGGAPFEGSMAGKQLAAPIVGIAGPSPVA